MKNKLFIPLIFIFLLNINVFSQKFYSIEQITDTLQKYSNVFEAFSELDTYYIPIKEFRQDSFLLNKSFDLFEIKKYKEFVIIRNTKEDYDNVAKSLLSKKYLIQDFINQKHLSKINKKKLLDSILNNLALEKIYIDSAINLDILNLKKGLSNYKWETTESQYINFHSKLMTQRGYDTIRAYYDKFYKNSLNFNEPVLIALIDMGDPEVIAKYDSVFTKKINKRTFNWNDYTQLNNFDAPFMYRMYARLIYYNKVDAGSQINATIAKLDFPVIYYKERDSIIEINNFYLDKKGNYRCKFVVPLDVISKYYTDFADYWEKREDNPKIKYKTQKK